jgi:RNA polymerase sigma-70 factor, ECF subfamily
MAAGAQNDPTVPTAVTSIRCVTLRSAQGHLEHGQGMTDGELVERVRSGETAAFGELVDRHRGAVFRAALAALGNDADAEDVAQEALVLAFRRFDQFRGDASVKTWMISIAWHVALSRRRRPIWRLKNMMAPDSELDRLCAHSASPEQQLMTAEFNRTIARQIRKLSPKLRDALLLTAAGDMTQDEIAATLNVPSATFRGRVRDARLKLKEKLRNQQ